MARVRNTALKKTFLHHLIPLSTWVAQGCPKRSRNDLECVLTQSTYYGLQIKVKYQELMKEFALITSTYLDKRAKEMPLS